MPWYACAKNTDGRIAAEGCFDCRIAEAVRHARVWGRKASHGRIDRRASPRCGAHARDAEPSRPCLARSSAEHAHIVTRLDRARGRTAQRTSSTPPDARQRVRDDRDAHVADGRSPQPGLEGGDGACRREPAREKCPGPVRETCARGGVREQIESWPPRVPRRPLQAARRTPAVAAPERLRQVPVRRHDRAAVREERGGRGTARRDAVGIRLHEDVRREHVRRQRVGVERAGRRRADRLPAARDDARSRRTARHRGRSAARWHRGAPRAPARWPVRAWRSRAG